VIARNSAVFWRRTVSSSILFGSRVFAHGRFGDAKNFRLAVRKLSSVRRPSERRVQRRGSGRMTPDKVEARLKVAGSQATSSPVADGQSPTFAVVAAAMNRMDVSLYI